MYFLKFSLVKIMPVPAHFLCIVDYNIYICVCYAIFWGFYPISWLSYFIVKNSVVPDLINMSQKNPQFSIIYSVDDIQLKVHLFYDISNFSAKFVFHLLSIWKRKNIGHMCKLVLGR